MGKVECSSSTCKAQLIVMAVVPATDVFLQKLAKAAKEHRTEKSS